MNKLISIMIAKHRAIFVFLTGGLGNQLFQLALANLLVQKSRVKVYAIGGGFRQGKKLSYGETFKLIAPNVNFAGTGYFVSRLVNFLFSRLSFRKECRSNIISETFSNGRVIRLSFRDYFEMEFFFGFWQDYNLIKHKCEQFVENLISILKDFHPTNIEIHESDILIHLRKGDFAHSRNGILAPSFYEQVPLGAFREVICLSDRFDYSYLTNVQILKVYESRHVTEWQVLTLGIQSKNCISSNSTLSWWMCYVSICHGGKVWMPDNFFQIPKLTDNLLRIPQAISIPSIFI